MASDEHAQTPKHRINIDRKTITPVCWDGEHMKINNHVFFNAPINEAMPEWVKKAVDSGTLKHGRIGWLELRMNGGVVFKECDEYGN